MSAPEESLTVPRSVPVTSALVANGQSAAKQLINNQICKRRLIIDFPFIRASHAPAKVKGISSLLKQEECDGSDFARRQHRLCLSTHWPAFHFWMEES
ncbi:MAG TPA: hypothetical protein VKX41_15625 [Alloacidobacterium sp.]|nr:hypothetical protein [Alloacidobacterium sp.]